MKDAMLKPIPEVMTVPKFEGEGIISFQEKAVPVPGPGQLLLQVGANALCGSERGQFYKGSNVTPGHEGAGFVVAAGPDTTTKAGTPGAVFLMDFCGECRSCALGFSNQCLQKRGDYGFNRDGGFGAYELVNENVFFAVDSDMTPTEATLLLDIMGTNGHGIRRAQLARKDIESAVVAGAGPIGLGALAMLKVMLGFDLPVVITDVVPYRLDLAEQMGGLPVNVAEQSLAEGLKRYGMDGVDAGFDTSGRGVARRANLDALSKRGVMVCIGHGEGLDLTVSPDLISPERAVLGSEYFCFNELPANLEYLRAHKDYLMQIITHRLPVREIQHAFEIFFEGNTGKVIIEQ